jgi:hypothetical protein
MQNANNAAPDDGDNRSRGDLHLRGENTPAKYAVSVLGLFP